MSRFKAASIHLAISLTVGASLFALFCLVWYPSPLFIAVGGLELFALLLAIDVTIGPFLTLVVYREGKRTLKFDLAVIALLQAAALGYGVLTLLAGRPVYIAALGFRFDLVQAHQVADSDLAAAGQHLPRFGPVWVGTREATDRKERERILFSALGGADYGHMPQHHASISTMTGALLKNARPIAELRARNQGNDDAISAWLEARGRDDKTAVYQGLKARSQDMAVILDAKTAEVIGIAPFKPWD